MPHSTGSAALIERAEAPTGLSGRDAREQPGPGTPRRAGGQLLTRITLVVVTGLVFAGVGGALTALSPERHVASTLLLVRQDPGLLDDNTASSPEISDRFLQSEVVTVESLAEEVTGGDEDTPVTVRQVGLTDIISIEAVGSTPEESAATANMVAEAYSEGRREQLADRAEAAAAAVRAQLDEVTASLRQQGAPVPDAPSPLSADALSTEYGRLLSLLNRIDLSIQGEGLTQVVRSADPGDAEPTSSALRNAALAGLLGALAAIALVVATSRSAWRSTSTVIRTRDDQ